MAKEHKKITLPPSYSTQIPDELEKLLNDGWEVKHWSYDPIGQECQYLLEREVPDHE